MLAGSSQTPDRLTTSQNHGGSSRRGPHRLASTACERFWFLRVVRKLRSRSDPKTRLTGTLIHTLLAYHYAAKMAEPPDWYVRQPDVDVALAHDANGHVDMIRDAKNVFMAWYQYFGLQDPWTPVAVEYEFEASLAEIKPTDPKYAWDDPSLDNEIITCRTDLVVRNGGDLWIVDHKSTGGGFGNTTRLPIWKEDSEWKLNFQIMVNLHILRTPANAAKLGGVVRGFIIQRLKQRVPYDFDRNLISISPLAYQHTPREIRKYVAAERDIIAKTAAGELPTMNTNMCWGRYGACDMFALCSSASQAEMENVLEHGYDVV